MAQRAVEMVQEGHENPLQGEAAYIDGSSL